MLYEKKVYNITLTSTQLAEFGFDIYENEDLMDVLNTPNKRDKLLSYLALIIHDETGIAWRGNECGVTANMYNGATENLFSFLVFHKNISKLEDVEYSENGNGSHRVTPKKQPTARMYKDMEKDLPNLTKYATNMCAEISEQTGYKNGCSQYIDRIIQTLSRQGKNFPVLVGDRGVGKTTIAYEFAKKIVNGEVPNWLKNKVLFSVSISKMVSGAKYRGDFEERLMNCLNEAEKDNRVILFFDNMHDIIGSGQAGPDSNLDGAGILEPYLTMGRISAVGTTTFEEYSHKIERNGKIARATQVISVEEPSVELAKEMLVETSVQMQRYHGVKISKEVAELTVDLAKRYKSNKCLPDSAVDLLDEACAKHRCKGGSDELDKSAIYEILSEQLNIPMNKLTQSDTERLKNLEKVLATRVIGQEDAVKAVANVVRNSRTGLNDEKKPLGSFIFAGSTGVGKTELCKTLAAELFDDENAVIRVDMSEYMESHTVSKLIGAPKGYVGYGEGGYLTDAVDKKPYSIVLFDEIEKAHPQIMNILLQVLDDGRLTDSMGKTVDFKNTIIIMTSNVGAKKKGEDSRIGFGGTSASDRKADFMSAIKATFKPEFVNRVSDIIIFNKLEDDTVSAITKKLLDEVVAICKKRDISITYDKSVVTYCVENGFDAENGVRPMQHFISKNVKSWLSNKIIDGTITAGGSYKVRYTNGLKLKELAVV